MVKDTTPVESLVENETETPNTGTLIEYTCVRCGFKYHKNIDYDPTLCYRCMRFISKRVYTIMQQIVPPVSTAPIGDI